MPSVTDIIELIVPEERKNYGIYPSVTSVIKSSGFGADFSNVPADIMARACARGEVVHKCCELIDKGTLDRSTVDPALEGYIQAYEGFLKVCQVKPIYIEEEMISEDFGYGGTPDLVCWMNGKRVIVDRKTTDPDSLQARLQTGGYETLVWGVHRVLIEKRYGLRLFDDGRFRLVEHKNATDESCFDDLLEYVKAKERRDKWISYYYLTNGDKKQ